MYDDLEEVAGVAVCVLLGYIPEAEDSTDFCTTKISFPMC